jgi:hypothetical protein
MKKTLITLTSLLIGTNLYALNLGDKLPDFFEGYDKGEVSDLKLWINETGTKTGWLIKYQIEGKKYMAAAVKCKLKTYPFGYTDFEKVYLDTDLDGIIDKIKPVEGNVGDDAPACPETRA